MRRNSLIILFLLIAVVFSLYAKNASAYGVLMASPSPTPPSLPSAAPTPDSAVTKSYDEIAAAIKSDKQLFSEASKCPADVVPTKGIDRSLEEDRSCPDRRKCLAKCQANDGASCYNLAVVLEQENLRKEGYDPTYTGALHWRACKLGIISGCTNRAAGLLRDMNDASATCSSSTFEKTCALDDPWGCTMYALSLWKGTGGIKVDLEKAKTAAKKSCKFNETDPACEAGKNIIEAIEKEQKAK